MLVQYMWLMFSFISSLAKLASDYKKLLLLYVCSQTWCLSGLVPGVPRILKRVCQDDFFSHIQLDMIHI
jgi:hypothetical protein